MAVRVVKEYAATSLFVFVIFDKKVDFPYSFRSGPISVLRL